MAESEWRTPSADGSSPAAEVCDSVVPTSSTSLPASCDESTSNVGNADDAAIRDSEDASSNGQLNVESPTNRLQTPLGGTGRRSSTSSVCGGCVSSGSTCSAEYIGYQLEASRMRQQVKQLQTDLDNERESVSFLRSKVAQLNKEKVELTSRHNEEVAELLEDSTTLRAMLERHEDAEQRHEYELGRLQLQLAQTEQAAASAVARGEAREALASAEAKAELERQRREADSRHASLAVEMQRLQDALAQKEAALEACCAERKSFECEKDELASTVLEQTRMIGELQQAIQQLQDELSQQQVSLGQCLNEAEQARDREKKLLEDLEAAERGIKMASEVVEEERVAHLESKIGAELLQKKQRDLELALAAEMQAKSEAHSKIEKLHGQLRDMEEAYANERKQNKAIRDRLEKADRELASCQKQLQVEVGDKRSIASNLAKQLDSHEAEMDAIRAELTKAKKKQSAIEDAQLAVVRELEVMLETFELNRDSRITAGAIVAAGAARDGSGDSDQLSTGSLGASATVDGVRRLLATYKSKLDAASDEVRKTRKLCESLAKEMSASKEELNAKEKALEDCRQQASTTSSELTALRMSSSEMDARIAAFKVDVRTLSHELDKECARNEELNNELTNALTLMKSAEDEHVRYLHGLRQRFTAAVPTAQHQHLQLQAAGGGGASALPSATARSEEATIAHPATVADAACAQGGGSSSSAYDKYSWADVSGVVLDQAVAVLAELSGLKEKVTALESAALNREAFIEELQQEHSRLTDRLRAAMEMQASHFVRQKQESEEHHRRTVKEIQHHSKKTLKMADEAWGKVRRTEQLQQELESECADLRQRVSAITEHHGALHAAFALLTGAHYPLLARANVLAAQRALLDDRLRQFDVLKAQCCQLLRALVFADRGSAATSDGLTAEERLRSSGRSAGVGSSPAARTGCLLLLRFRAAAIAVIAANRLLQLHRQAAQKLHFVDGSNTHCVVYVGEIQPGRLSDTEHSAVVSARRGCGDYIICDWLTSRGLLSAVVTCMEEIQGMLRENGSDDRGGALHDGNLAAAATASFRRLSDRLEACFPGLRSSDERHGTSVPLRHRDRSSLHRQLGNGLHTILARLSGADVALPSQPAQLIFDNLQQHVLSLIQRLHANEVERQQTRQALADAERSSDERATAYAERCRALQAELNELVHQRDQRVSTSAYDGLRRELDGALSRERQAQELLAEQSRQMAELGSKLSSDTTERLMSERALRASAQSVAGLQATLQQKEEELRKASSQLAQTESERRAIHAQLFEAERALQSAARDKESIADYVRGVHVSLQQCGPSDAVGRLLLSAGERLHIDRGGPELVACQKLVGAFVDALHQASTRATALREEVALHKKHVGRLKDELSSICRRENSVLNGGGSLLGTRLPHELSAGLSSPYMEDVAAHNLPDGSSEASFSTSASRSEGHRRHRRRSEHRQDLAHNGNHRNATGAFGASY